jgi:group I intron endonuclease
MIKDPGVYCWRNRINGKVYVGSAAHSLALRRRSHVKELRGGRHANRHLQNAWNHYGFGVFVFKVLERCPAELCVEREQYWIDSLKAADPTHGYNLCPYAGSNYGLRWSDESRERWSVAQQGKPCSEATRQRMSESQQRVWDDPLMAAARMAGLRRAHQRLKDPDVRARKSARMKGKQQPHLITAVKASWADPEGRARRIAAMKAAWQRRKGAASAAKIL